MEMSGQPTDVVPQIEPNLITPSAAHAQFTLNSALPDGIYPEYRMGRDALSAVSARQLVRATISKYDLGSVPDQYEVDVCVGPYSSENVHDSCVILIASAATVDKTPIVSASMDKCRSLRPVWLNRRFARLLWTKRRLDRLAQ